MIRIHEIPTRIKISTGKHGGCFLRSSSDARCVCNVGYVYLDGKPTLMFNHGGTEPAIVI